MWRIVSTMTWYVTRWLFLGIFNLIDVWSDKQLPGSKLVVSYVQYLLVQT